MNDRGNGRQLCNKYENINALIMTWKSIELLCPLDTEQDRACVY